jgi:hypothetical protein
LNFLLLRRDALKRKNSGQGVQKERRVNFGLAYVKATTDFTDYTDLICHKKAQKVSASDAFSTNLSFKASFVESFVIDHEVNFVAFRQNADSGRNKFQGNGLTLSFFALDGTTKDELAE